MRATDPATPTGPRPASLTVRTATGAGWVMAWRWTSRVLGLVNTLVLVRLLAPTDFGLVALASSFSQAIDWFSEIGVSDALVREKQPDRAMYDTAFTLNAVRGVVVAAVVALGAYPVAEYFGDLRLGPILLALAGAMLISSFANIATVQFQRDLEFHRRFGLQIVARVGGIAAAISFAWIYRNYWALVAGIIATRLLRVLASYVMLPYRPRLTLSAWRRLIVFSLWLWAIGVVQMIRDRVDAVVIGRALGPTSVGTYAVGVEIGSLTSSELVEPVTAALFAAFSAARRQGSDVASSYFRAIAATFLLTLPLGFGLSLLAAPVVNLTLGARWVVAVPIVQIFAILGMARVIGYFSSVLLNAHAMMNVQFRIELASLVVRVALILLLIRPYGLFGAAYAAIACLVVEEVLYLVATFRHFHLRAIDLWRSNWRCLLGTTAMAAVLVIEGVGWAPVAPGIAPALRAIGIGVVSGATTYCLVVFAAWWAGGRPDGAETYLFDGARQTVRHLFRRRRVAG